MRRRDFKNVLEAMACIHSTSSSDEDDLKFLLVNLAFAPQRVVIPHLSLMDMSNLQCDQLFRRKYKPQRPSQKRQLYYIKDL